MNENGRRIRTALPVSSQALLVHSSGQNYVYGVSYKSKYAYNSTTKRRHSSSERKQHLCQFLISFPCELCTTNDASFDSTLFIDSQMHLTAGITADEPYSATNDGVSLQSVQTDVGDVLSLTGYLGIVYSSDSDALTG